MTVKTFGRLRYAAVEPRGLWEITGQPHVMMRAKRIFGRVQANRQGSIILTDTLDVARDIEWLIDRHPLEMDDLVRQRLTDRAKQHRDRETTVASILSGGYQPPASKLVPARAPREYQLVAADLAVATGHLLITDEVGLGKSMTGALVLRAPDAFPALVVTLTHLPRQWVGEFEKTFPELKVHIVTETKPYDPATRRGSQGLRPDVFVMNYHKLAPWADYLAGYIKTVIFDEAQELRHDGTGKYNAAAQIADQATFKVGLTASPVYNYGGEMYNVMSVLAPDVLGTREEFVREWGAGSWSSHVSVNDPAALGNYLRDEGLMIGRTRKEVGRELPEIVRVTHPIDSDEDALEQLSGDAVRMAQLIFNRAASSNDRWRASGDLDWRLRQATGIAKAPYVAEFVRVLLESEEQVVLFGWHRAVYDIWAEKLKEFHPAFYTGGESATKKLCSENDFKSGKARVLIMSNRSGAGLDGLQDRAHVCVFGELDWSPEVHMQCIGRLHRDGQDDPVVAYFLVSDDGSDPVIAEVLNLKRMQSEPMLMPDAQLRQATIGGQDRVKMLAAQVLQRAGVDYEDEPEEAAS